MIRLLPLGLFLVLCFAKASTAMRICNYSNETAVVSVAGIFKNTPFTETGVSQGWWHLSLGQCSDFPPGGRREYFLAKGRSGILLGSNTLNSKTRAFCVSLDSDFEYSAEKGFDPLIKVECEDQGLQMRSFFALDSPGANVTLTGGKPNRLWVQLINETSHDIWVAYGTKREGEWVTNGYIPVRRRKTKYLDLGNYFQHDVYIFARTKKYRYLWGSGGTQFCINDNLNTKFEILKADLVPCDPSISRRVLFSKIPNPGKPKVQIFKFKERP